MFDLKDGSFLDLVDSDNSILEPSYCKGSTWLKYFGHSNMLCTRATRAITNHAPIGEYWLHFFPNEVFSCPCGLYPIESRQHILHKCRRFNEYWNSRRDSVGHFIFRYSFLLFFFFLSLCCFCLHVCSYKVVTMVCHQALCNKVLI